MINVNEVEILSGVVDISKIVFNLYILVIYFVHNCGSCQ